MELYVALMCLIEYVKSMWIYSKTFMEIHVAALLWPSVGVKPNTSKVEDLESSGTPECLEFDSRDQNTSH
jgi:hypothetical protein